MYDKPKKIINLKEFKEAKLREKAIQAVREKASKLPW